MYPDPDSEIFEVEAGDFGRRLITVTGHFKRHLIIPWNLVDRGRQETKICFFKSL